MPTSEGKYKLSYDIGAGPITQEEALATGRGACDDIVIISVIREESGATSDLLLSMNGDTHDELSSIDLFKRWVTMAARLENEDLPNWASALVALTLDRARAHLTKNRDG